MSQSTQLSNIIDMPMPKVTIDRMVLERIRHYVHQCDTEISGFGFATVKDGKFHIMDARVVKQDAVSMAHTDINKDALNGMMYEWRLLEGVLVWWHSHVNMSTGWSSTDRDTIMDLGKHHMCLAMVFNKRHEQRCALAFRSEIPFMDKPQIVMIDDIPVAAYLEVPKETTDAWDKELIEALPPPRPVVDMASWSDEWGFPHHRSRGGDMWLTGNDHKWDPAEFWDDATIGAANDCDWSKGSHWFESEGKWRKSWKQRQKEAAEKRAQAIIVTSTPPVGSQFVGSPSAIVDSIHESRRAFATEDEDILQYRAISDEFELVGGVWVDAEWYIKTVSGPDNPMRAFHGLSEAEVEDLYQQVKKERETADVVN